MVTISWSSHWEHHQWTYMVWLTQAVTLCGHNVPLAIVVTSRKISCLSLKGPKHINLFYVIHSSVVQSTETHALLKISALNSYSYADNSVTNEMLSKEAATFSSTNRDPFVVKDIVFGCGHNNKGSFNENDMGMIGMGGGPLSLVSQIGNLYGRRRFSQCLVPFHTDPHISGAIGFGEASDVSGEGVVTTPLVSEDGQTLYMVTLEGIGVGDTFVPFNSSEMLSKGNIMIDSGTPATYIPQDFYNRLVEEVKKQISLVPVTDDLTLGTQLCYRTERNLEGPILTAHFEGAHVQLTQTQTFIPPKDGVFCFAMAGADGGLYILYIFGNFAQSNILIGFDLDRNTVSFKPTDYNKQ
ncbi:hypothetical protein RJT34_05222 [Clitoria ternatea]|uniref:Peptidase A1 domain-containing protein n=1 Tax=Clitoria ternatea TaxID=43366 RepID=A0AAN9PTI2_CLITE